MVKDTDYNYSEIPTLPHLDKKGQDIIFGGNDSKMIKELLEDQNANEALKGTPMEAALSKHLILSFFDPSSLEIMRYKFEKTKIAWRGQFTEDEFDEKKREQLLVSDILFEATLGRARGTQTQNMLNERIITGDTIKIQKSVIEESNRRAGILGGIGKMFRR